jgi:hypothetical protein
MCRAACVDVLFIPPAECPSLSARSRLSYGLAGIPVICDRLFCDCCELTLFSLVSGDQMADRLSRSSGHLPDLFEFSVHRSEIPIIGVLKISQGVV